MAPKATVGILSLGDMGQGMARLLHAHDFRVVTNASGRSSYTERRAAAASVELLETDVELAHQCDYILSIVPPRDALDIATRVSRALNSAPPRPSSSPPLYFVDLNATSPLTAQKVAGAFAGLPDTTVRVVDGGIMGGPPHRTPPPQQKQPDGAGSGSGSSGDASAAAKDGSAAADEVGAGWYRPRVAVSGPHRLGSAPRAGALVEQLLNVRHVHGTIGPATGLKMVFASLNKGFTALAIQAFATAQALEVLPELRETLAEQSPALGRVAERNLPGMCPKAYRWVDEMEQIADTMRLFGGFRGRSGSAPGVDGEDLPARLPSGGDLFSDISDIYRFIADDTPLGQQRIGERTLGTSAEDVARVCAENLRPQKTTDS